MLDRYFKSPILWDYLFAIIVAIAVGYLVRIDTLILPTDEHLYSTISDMCTIALTMAGFILTLLTLLITFKSTNNINKDSITENDKVFDIFFASSLYFQTTNILRDAIKSLTIISIIGYLFKLLSTSSLFKLLYCVLGIIVIVLTIWRCLFILSKIVRMQEND